MIYRYFCFVIALFPLYIYINISLWAHWKMLLIDRSHFRLQLEKRWRYNSLRFQYFNDGKALRYRFLGALVCVFLADWGIWGRVNGIAKDGKGGKMRLEEEKERKVRKISKKRTRRTRMTRMMRRLKIDYYYFNSYIWCFGFQRHVTLVSNNKNVNRKNKNRTKKFCLAWWVKKYFD